MMDTSHLMHRHDRSRTQRAATWFAAIGMVVALAAISLCVYWLVWPYDDFVVDPGPLPLTNVTERQNGLPVIDQSEVLSFTFTGLCNEGVDVISVRWFDMYDRYLFFEAGVAPSASISAPPWMFYEESTGELTCPSEVPVTVKVPNYIEHGFVYRLRLEMSYSPNPVRTITETVVTEQFRLVD